MFATVDCWPPYGAHLTLEFATTATTPTSSDNTAAAADGEHHYVRAVYNNKDMQMFGGTAPVWCPLETFWNAMEGVACSPAEFQVESNRIPEDEEDFNREGELRSDVEMTAKEVEEEIAASITGKI